MSEDRRDKDDNSIRIDRSHDNTYNVTNSYTNNNYTNNTQNNTKTINNYYNGRSRKPLSKKAIAGIIIACIILLIAVICIVGVVNSKSATEVYTLSISSTPSGANIYFDDVYKGTTPLKISGVIAGTHLIRATLANYNDYNNVISVRKSGSLDPIVLTKISAGTSTIATDGGQAVVHVEPTVNPTAVSTVSPTVVQTLTPTVKPTVIQTQAPVSTGTLVVNTNPHGASIYIDGVLKGVTPTSPVGPLSISGLSPGTHSIKVECENYQTLSQEVSIVADEYTTLTLSLQLVDNPVLKTDAEVADFFAGKMGSKAKLKSGGAFTGGTVSSSHPLTLDLMDATIGPIKIEDGADLTVLSSPGTGAITNKFKISDEKEVSVFGVYVSQKGKFTLKSGSIVHIRGSIPNRYSDVYCNGNVWGVDNYGVFVMDGGQIVDNGLDETCGYKKMSLSKAGGVFNHGTFIMNGGYITGNYHNIALIWDDMGVNNQDAVSGGVITASSAFTMNGGTIHDNTPYNVCYIDTGEKITTTVTST